MQGARWTDVVFVEGKNIKNLFSWVLLTALSKTEA